MVEKTWGVRIVGPTLPNPPPPVRRNKNSRADLDFSMRICEYDLEAAQYDERDTTHAHVLDSLDSGCKSGVLLSHQRQHTKRLC
jgi:hypothetical protein